jgi:gluconolactonase
MTHFKLVASVLLAATITAHVACAEDTAPSSIPGIGPAGPVVKLHTGFQFTEGPAGDRNGNVYFSDVAGNKTYKIDTAGQLSEFRDPSNHGNGLMVNAAGELVTCEMDGRLVAVAADGKHARVLVDNYQGNRFNAPNDLAIDRQGGIYFSDPRFRAPEPLPQGVEAVYYLAPDGKLTRLVDDLKAPNGVGLSPDERMLYVIPSMQDAMMAYPIQSPGQLGPGRVFCRLQQGAGKKDGGGDGMALDAQGNLYITSALGLQVYDPAGKMLGIIAIPEQPANVKFGGPQNRTLFVTARKSVYTVPMAVAGPAPKG